MPITENPKSRKSFFLIISLKCNHRNLEIRVMVVAESVANRNLEQRPRRTRLQFRCLREVIRGLAAGLERSPSYSQLHDSTRDNRVLTCPSVEAAKPFCDSSMPAPVCRVRVCVSHYSTVGRGLVRSSIEGDPLKISSGPG
jgi:hypothetical protein